MFILTNKKKIILSSLLSLLIVSGAVFYKVRAGAFLPFGGMILYTFPCTCSANLLVTVGTPRGGVFVYQPGASQIFSHFAIHPGAWILGGFEPVGVCLQYVGKGCVPIPNEGTIVMAGTSL